MRNIFKAIVFGIGICVACSGCGSGTSVIAMVSPTISQVTPQVVTAGTASVTVTVQGQNFSSTSALTVNGTAMPTSFVSASTLAAQISGTPLAKPNVAQLQVKNTDGSQSNQVPLTVTSAPSSPSALSIATPTLASGQVGVLYSGNFSATGGTPGYTWAVTSGSLPAGMTLTSAGVLSGTPSVATTSTFAITVTDSGSPSQQKTVTLSIVVMPVVVTPPSLTASSASLAAGQVGSAYAASLNATGGTPGYTWSVVSGSLPAGLALSSAGVISGMPTTSGTATFTAAVKDSGSPAQTASVSETITVKASSLSITTSGLGTGQVGNQYLASLSASGGTPGYTWSISSGSLPAGLTLSSGGVISGLPAGNGTATFTVSVKDNGSPAQTATAQETIVVGASKLAITTTGLAGAKNGASYSSTLSASGGTPGYTWSISSGSLPAGLTLSSGGVISGAATTSGTVTFTVAVTDSSSPANTATAQETIVVGSSTLAIMTTSLAGAKNGSAYSSALSASGGTPGYTWSMSSGSLPAGLTLSSGGVISGTATTSGTVTFTVAVTDSSSPANTATAQETIVVGASGVVITTASLGVGQSGSAYTAALSASGGTPGYTWTVSSGSLPAGLSLSSTGLITGTPSASGSFNFVVGVTDSGSPAQTQTATLSISISGATASGPGTTWYVRPDGGTRYSINVQNGQCDGQGDAPYPGSGVNQHCAFNDVRYMWQDGSQAYGAGMPGWGWVISGGDTVIIRGSIGSGVSYRIGWNNNSSSFDAATNQYWGLQGDPYDSGIPVPPSGTVGQHTRILGENYAACHTAAAKTQLHGGYGVVSVIDMSGASYVDLACLDITDFSSCGRASQAMGCNTNPGSLSDFATYGISWANTSTNDTLTDVHIHGLGNSGMVGPTGTGMVFKYLDILGNASSGWNADDGSGTTGWGTLLVQNYNISWNGCAEEYPMVDAVPYGDCTDDNGGGYGDGFGTTSIPSSPAWNVHFDQGVVSYNTQDGLDAKHLTGPGSTVTVTSTLAYGNMGQQIKVGGAAGTLINNVIVGNCNALKQSIPGTPSGYNSKLSDFCRAADTAVVMNLGKGTTTTVQFNTLYSAQAVGYELDCDTSNGNCDSTSLVDFRNNVFVGFQNSAPNGYVGGGSGEYSDPIYLTNSSGSAWPNPFLNSGSLYTNNVTYHPKSNWVCPQSGESNAICADPNLTDETWHLYGYGNMAPLSGSTTVQGAGAVISGVIVDYTGAARGNPPSIGAYE